MGVTIYQVDAFTEQPYKGNPAAVCLLEVNRSEEWMQSVAAEMNLSETAFLFPEGDGYRLRWFTPKSEVKLCGHATLASAHILYKEKRLPLNCQARFSTLSGLLTARYYENTGLIELDFPATSVISCEPPYGLVEALGVKPIFVGRSDDDYLIEVASEDEVKKVVPNFVQLLQVSCRGVIVTALSYSDEYDFISRFFAPAVGVNEDPVTGSAHCRLTPYWQAKLGKNEFTAYQASKRGGFLKLAMKGDRVCISGKAVTILKGELVD
ncbi:PhzF family phenazine biosynthesis protein [Sporomusaceae bacterium BoRhaA]|uniref:PhzF family phenazine biosynthesis protein n=1 Tax=Pelorhabdus rhamnosifermentans TaxID=2772457 RepID=UPI001C05F382|nr:PhzF family phenazine biosynthesis protein [Pelorhabdus rhamnosifermentans]MBU2703732.1 PhzF family phenazine biosynthesis protein [Pelorhabdus rhamnosifermentans]